METISARVAVRPVTNAWRDRKVAVAMGMDFLLTELERRYNALLNDVKRVAGIAVRLQVRAGLDPHILSVDDMVKDVMRGDHGVRHMTLENRALCAAAAIRGWVEAGRG